MVRVNANYDLLAAGYLFPEIARRAKAYAASHPGVRILRLGIGDTTLPLTPSVIAGLHQGVDRLSRAETYTGYGDYEGETSLRQAIASDYQARDIELAADEIFVSDGAKPDSGNIQSIFSPDAIVAVQDPAYPVYVDTNVIAGRAGRFDAQAQRYHKLVYLPCTEQDGFFPELPQSKVDLIYLCSPNNPTGNVATFAQLGQFVEYARREKAIIIFDAAYRDFIKDPTLPQSIYEIEGARDCAIEIYSFSKGAGFTGVRLGWAVVPKTLRTEDAPIGKLHQLWTRRQCTFFNGASNVVQAGGLAAMSPEGRRECRSLVDYYMQNARIIVDTLHDLGLTTFGGVNAPYIWLRAPGELTSWEFFDKLLDEAQVLGTPGVGFGPAGEGFLRLSAFGQRDTVERAAHQIRSQLRLG